MDQHQYLCHILHCVVYVEEAKKKSIASVANVKGAEQRLLVLLKDAIDTGRKEVAKQAQDDTEYFNQLESELEQAVDFVFHEGGK
jgi:hypothetical protein